MEYGGYVYLDSWSLFGIVCGLPSTGSACYVKRTLAIINGVATILMFMFIDPYLSMLTEEVAEGKVTEPYFRRSIVWLTGSRVMGTIAAQLLLIPAAFSIVAIAEWL